MNHTLQFRRLREAKHLRRERLASLAGCHRNTVINVETGRPVKFSTIADLLHKMGYGRDSVEMKSMAMLWLEGISGLKLTLAEGQKTVEQLRSSYRRSVRASQEELSATIQDQGLLREQIDLLAFAARHPEALEILRSVRNFVETYPVASDEPRHMLKAAEE
ncbi:MAG: helix-turn-helix transcriptional regulator [Verrucomicrobiota bacterium]|nr:helix-turn-helix transcriptional regulator [Verrucomicrobiota bacterium]